MESDYRLIEWQILERALAHLPARTRTCLVFKIWVSARSGGMSPDRFQKEMRELCEQGYLVVKAEVHEHNKEYSYTSFRRIPSLLLHDFSFRKNVGLFDCSKEACFLEITEYNARERWETMTSRSSLLMLTNIKVALAAEAPGCFEEIHELSTENSHCYGLLTSNQGSPA